GKQINASTAMVDRNEFSFEELRVRALERRTIVSYSYNDRVQVKNIGYVEGNEFSFEELRVMALERRTIVSYSYNDRVQVKNIGYVEGNEFSFEELRVMALERQTIISYSYNDRIQVKNDENENSINKLTSLDHKLKDESDIKSPRSSKLLPTKND
ncbi:5789_t:CDS:1, partial [Scutellospora calospora]